MIHELCDAPPDPDYMEGFHGHGTERRHGDSTQRQPREYLDVTRGISVDVSRHEPPLVFDYGHTACRSKWDNEQDDSGWRERQGQGETGSSISSQPRFRYEGSGYGTQASTYKGQREYCDSPDRRLRRKEYEQDADDSSRRHRSKSRDSHSARDRESDSRRDRDSRRDHERRRSRGYSSGERDREPDYRSRRRSRSRDRDRERSERDRHRRRRGSGERERRGSGERERRGSRDRERRHRDHDKDRLEEGRVDPKGSRNKDIPWVPPPLPEHLRHMQVQWALAPVASSAQHPSALSSSSSAAPPRPPGPSVLNQFQNDGSFMEMFRQRQKMLAQGGVGPVSDDSVSLTGSEGPSASGSWVTSSQLPAPAPAEVVDPTPAPPPTLPANSSGLPVIAKRRISKILKTGIVQKKKKPEEEDEDKGGNGWNSYMKEVQKYRANKCIENEAGRPPLVK